MNGLLHFTSESRLVDGGKSHDGEHEELADDVRAPCDDDDGQFYDVESDDDGKPLFFPLW